MIKTAVQSQFQGVVQLIVQLIAIHSDTITINSKLVSDFLTSIVPKTQKSFQSFKKSHVRF